MRSSPLPPEATAGTSIAVAGDWHGSERAVSTVLARIARERPDIRVVHQLGDHGLWPGREGHRFNQLIEKLTRRHQLTIVVTPGNHEWYDRLHADWAPAPNAPIPVRGRAGTWFLPRGYRWTHAGRSMVWLGGAASPDRAMRRPGHGWWPHERIGDSDMVRTIIGGTAEVMFAHESPAPGTRLVERRAAKREQVPAEDLQWMSESRRRLTLVHAAVRPQLLLHGHYHVADSMSRIDGSRVESLSMEREPGSFVYLDLQTLDVTRST